MMILMTRPQNPLAAWALIFFLETAAVKGTERIVHVAEERETGLMQ